MDHAYFERLHRDEQRHAEWRMLDTAMRCRRRNAFPRSLLAAALWALSALFR